MTFKHNFVISKEWNYIAYETSSFHYSIRTNSEGGEKSIKNGEFLGKFVAPITIMELKDCLDVVSETPKTKIVETLKETISKKFNVGIDESDNILWEDIGLDLNFWDEDISEEEDDKFSHLSDDEKSSIEFVEKKLKKYAGKKYLRFFHKNKNVEDVSVYKIDDEDKLYKDINYQDVNNWKEGYISEITISENKIEEKIIKVIDWPFSDYEDFYISEESFKRQNEDDMDEEEFKEALKLIEKKSYDYNGFFYFDGEVETVQEYFKNSDEFRSFEKEALFDLNEHILSEEISFIEKLVFEIFYLEE